MTGLAKSISRVTKSFPEFIGIEVNSRGFATVHFRHATAHEMQ